MGTLLSLSTNHGSSGHIAACQASAASQNSQHRLPTPCACGVLHRLTGLASFPHIEALHLWGTVLGKGFTGSALSGCQSFGCLLTHLQRQSATRHRLVSRPSFGGQRTDFGDPTVQSLWVNWCELKTGGWRFAKAFDAPTNSVTLRSLQPLPLRAPA